MKKLFTLKLIVEISHQYSLRSALSHIMSKFLVLLAICTFTNAKILLEKSTELLDAPTINNEPMIGVLTQEISFYLDGKYPGMFKSYIAASYVKFVEGGGARAVPIW